MQEDKNIKTATHVTIIDGAKYIVVSKYLGTITIFDLMKKMIKRDLEKQYQNKGN